MSGKIENLWKYTDFVYRLSRWKIGFLFELYTPTIFLDIFTQMRTIDVQLRMEWNTWEIDEEGETSRTTRKR